MTLRLSKFVLALEAAVVVAPITFLFSMIAIERFLASIDAEGAWQIELPTFVIVVVSLAAGWSLMARFWRYGAERLRNSSILWAAALIGAAGVLIAIVCLVSGAPSHWAPDLKRSIWMLAWGLPLLLPLGHLFAERRFRSAPAGAGPETKE